MSKSKAKKQKNTGLPSSVRTFTWSLAASFIIALGLPLLFDVYLSLTPQLEPHLERESTVIALYTARSIALAVFVMGSLLAYRRWREEQKLKVIQQKVRAFRKRKQQEKQESNTLS
ncbi:hypothetical protein CWE15_06850 [Aliidiomarina taiwanensis]|uniref:Uncharacterized protein n=1 Tax=Aliidiomarina taiwanensis TaxID=946228 RepID=A0A432X1L9_9GAMM|nr:hypothetical protein [Aliidiomarina taiwanensis]RUO40471.1 hypothetical protein CWE15_06850 [Aliidiomarina taiwanensis]